MHNNAQTMWQLFLFDKNDQFIVFIRQVIRLRITLCDNILTALFDEFIQNTSSMKPYSRTAIKTC